MTKNLTLTLTLPPPPPEKTKQKNEKHQSCVKVAYNQFLLHLLLSISKKMKKKLVHLKTVGDKRKQGQRHFDRLSGSNFYWRTHQNITVFKI